MRINVHIVDREDKWFERIDKETLAKLAKPQLNRGGAVRRDLSATYTAVYPIRF